MNKELEDFVKKANLSKNIYTAGPSSLLNSALIEIKPCFGRNDNQYQEAKEYVIKYLSRMTSHENLISLQGSATLAIEIAIANFCRGKILVIETGYYSKRIYNILKKQNNIILENIDYHSYDLIAKLPKEKYDWILCCYTETSCAFKVDINLIKAIAVNVNAKILLDATASIGLEENHELADVICYSSCKGLFGLTGGAFIAYKDIEIFSTNSIYLDINTHKSNSVTGPYHQILSLYGVLQNYSIYLERVKKWHKYFLEVFQNKLIYFEDNQPVLCTLINCKLAYKESNPIPYKPRIKNKGEVICHIGQVHREYNSINKNLIKKHFQIIKN